MWCQFEYLSTPGIWREWWNPEGSNASKQWIHPILYSSFCSLWNNPLFVRFERMCFSLRMTESVWSIHQPFPWIFPSSYLVVPFLFSYIRIPHISFRHCLSTKKLGATVEGLESPGCSPRARCFDRYWPTCGFLSIMAPKKLLRFRVSKKNSTKLSFDSNLMIVTMFSP